MQRLVVLAMLLAAPTAQASHMGDYGYLPTEHDDQGRSVEPDFAETAVLGPRVANRVVDTDLDGVAVPDAALPRPFPGIADVVAPGCWDDFGRQPSGLCGLYNTGISNPAGAAVPILPPGLLGVKGMSGILAPGAFTPTKATQVRFLDARLNAQVSFAGTYYLELNRKLDDAAARAGLAGPVDVVAGPTAGWAWYGRWQDKNGNGVIDSRYDAPALAFPPAPPDDEFVWYGNCRQYPDAPAPQSVAARFCAYDTEAAAGGTTRMWGFLFPGNHHSYCGGTWEPTFSCGPHPADLPGRQVIHFLGSLGVPLCNPGSFPGFLCPPDGADLDAYGEQWLGDPLLDPQGSPGPDQAYEDRTGDPRLAVRQWVYGLGWPVWFYDQSLAVTLLHVTTVGCAAGPANLVALGTCRFADVDAYHSLSPALEELLQGQAKPALRGAWVFVRDLVAPLHLKPGPWSLEVRTNVHADSRAPPDADAFFRRGV